MTIDLHVSKCIIIKIENMHRELCVREMLPRMLFMINSAGNVSPFSEHGSVHYLHHNDDTYPKAWCFALLCPESSGLPDTVHTRCVC